MNAIKMIFAIANDFLLRFVWMIKIYFVSQVNIIVMFKPVIPTIILYNQSKDHLLKIELLNIFCSW